MTNSQKPEPQILSGVVQRYYASNPDTPSGNPSPYKLTVESGGVEFELSAFPKDGLMPSVFAGLDLNNIEGQTIQAIGTLNSTYAGKQQYRVASIEVTNGVAPNPPVATDPATQANPPATSAPAPATPPAPMTRYEAGAAKGNAISSATALLAAYISKTGKIPSLVFLEEAAGIVNTISEAILSGRTVELEPEEPTPEPTPEPASDDDDVDSTTESFGAISMDTNDQIIEEN